MVLRGRAWEELVRLVSLNKVQAVLSQICDYTSVSVNAVLELLFKLTSFNKLSLRGRTCEEQVSKTSPFRSLICDYSPVSIN